MFSIVYMYTMEYVPIVSWIESVSCGSSKAFTLFVKY